MDTQEITLTQDSDDGLYTQLLRGRYVTSINDDCITLDNGLVLTIEGNEGCMACANGWYHLEQIFKQGNSNARIMSAHVEHSQDNNYSAGCEIYTIFVMVDGNPHQLPLATIRGDDGPGGYGTGFTLTATIQKPPTVTATVTSRDIINALVDGQTPSDVPDIRNREDLLNAVVYTLQQTRGFDSPLRITGPEAQLFRKLASIQYGDRGPYYVGAWYGFHQTLLLWFADMEGGLSLVLRDLSNGAEGYVAKLRDFTERVRASKEPIKTFVTGYDLKGDTATVNGVRVPATDFLLSEVCGFHGNRIGYESTYIHDWIFFRYGVRIIKHRGGGRGDVTITSDTQSVWAVNPQEDTTL